MRLAFLILASAFFGLMAGARALFEMQHSTSSAVVVGVVAALFAFLVLWKFLSFVDPRPRKRSGHPADFFPTGGGDLTIPGDELVGTILAGRYTLTRLLGAGGMGVVYLAKDSLSGEECAVKVLVPQKDTSLSRFKREVRSLKKLSNHPNIVNIYDLYEDPKLDLLFYTMEHIEGATLSELLHRNELQTNPDLSIRIAQDILDALLYSHSFGIIHRDLKPSNIMIGKDGVVKVLDFGIATMLFDPEQTKVTQADIMGTFYYLAPELLTGGNATIQSDLYSLGVVFYQMLTGTMPIGNFKYPHVANIRLKKAVGEFVLSLMSPAPEDRPHDVARAFADMLKAHTAPHNVALTGSVINQAVDGFQQKTHQDKVRAAGGTISQPAPQETVAPSLPVRPLEIPSPA